MQAPPWAAVGTGGHLRALLDAMELPPGTVAAAPWQPHEPWPACLQDLPVVLAVGDCAARAALAAGLPAGVMVAPPLVAPSAHVAATAVLGPGCQIMAGAHVGPDAVIGEHAIINTAAVVEHNAVVGAAAHVGPRSVLLGGARVCKGVLLGAGAVVLPGVAVGEWARVGAGAVVVEAVVAAATVVGVPARPQPSSSTDEGSQHARWCVCKPLRAAAAVRLLTERSVPVNQFTNDGPVTSALAEEVQRLCRLSPRQRALCTASGTAALHAVYAAWAIEHDNRAPAIVTQAYTFPSAAVGSGAAAAVIDGAGAHRPLPAPQQLAAAAARADVVVLTLPFGDPAVVTWLPAAAAAVRSAAPDAWLLLDCAASPLMWVPDGAGGWQHAAELADATILSLHETKPLGRGEGGVVMARAALLPALHRAINFGFCVGESVRRAHPAATNGRMSDVAAAFALPHVQAVRASLTSGVYDGGVAAAAAVRAAASAAGCMPAFAAAPDTPTPPARLPQLLACIPLVAPDADAAANLRRRLLEAGVDVKQYYTPLSPSAEAPAAWQTYERMLMIPCHPQLDVALVVHALTAE